MRWGRVASLNPLRVRLVEESTPLDMTPRTLVESLGAGDLVRCEFVPGRELIIVGRAEEDGSFIGEHKAGEWATSPHPAWLLANGATHLIADYPKLAAHYASVYGAANFHGGNGLTTFAVPDTRERTYVNQGGSDIFADIGAKTGTKTHTLTQAEMPSHRHSLSFGTGGAASGSRIAFLASTNAVGTDPGAVATTGGGAAHNNVQPSFVCRFVIRAA